MVASVGIGDATGEVSMEVDGDGNDGNGPENALMVGGAFPEVDIFGLVGW